MERGWKGPGLGQSTAVLGGVREQRTAQRRIAKSTQGLGEMRVLMTWQELGTSADFRSLCLCSVEVMRAWECGYPLNKWPVPGEGNRAELGWKAKSDSNRSSGCSGSQEICLLLSCRSPTALGTAPHGTGDALIQPGHRGFTAPLGRALWRWNHDQPGLVWWQGWHQLWRWRCVGWECSSAESKVLEPEQSDQCFPVLAGACRHLQAVWRWNNEGKAVRKWVVCVLKSHQSGESLMKSTEGLWCSGALQGQGLRGGAVLALLSHHSQRQSQKCCQLCCRDANPIISQSSRTDSLSTGWVCCCSTTDGWSWHHLLQDIPYACSLEVVCKELHWLIPNM